MEDTACTGDGTFSSAVEAVDPIGPAATDEGAEAETLAQELVQSAVMPAIDQQGEAVPDGENAPAADVAAPTGDGAAGEEVAADQEDITMDDGSHQEDTSINGGEPKSAVVTESSEPPDEAPEVVDGGVTDAAAGGTPAVEESAEEPPAEEKEDCDAPEPEGASVSKSSGLDAAEAPPPKEDGAAPAEKVPSPKRSKRKSKGAQEPEGTPLERCASILAALMKHRDAWWFAEPVPADTDGYFEVIASPMDYGTINDKLTNGTYDGEAAFAADVRLVATNAVTYSPDPANDCNKAARVHLALFERSFVKQGLATDGGAAAAAAEEAAKPPTRKKQKVA